MPLAAQFLAYFTPSEHFTHSLLQHFTPLAAQLLSHFNPSEQITPSFLNLFTPLPIGRQALTSFCPFSTIYPLTLTSFYPRWQPSSNLILTPLSNWPTHSYNILHPPPLAAQLLSHCTPSEEFTHSHLQHFTTVGNPALTSLYTSEQLTIDPLILTTFYPPPTWQPSSILLPLTNLLTHTSSEQITHSLLQHFTPLAAQLLSHFTPSDEFTHSHLQHFTSVGNQALTSLYPSEQLTIDPLVLTTFYPLPLGSPAPFYSRWPIYSLTLTIFYLPWQPSSYLILPPLNKLPPHTYNILPPLATQL